MRHLMSLKSRRELRTSTAPRYQKAAHKEKQIILNEFAAVTGYHRKYAIRLLNAYSSDIDAGNRRERKPRARIYDENVHAALVVVWEAANRICSKRLVPFLPEMVAVLERWGHLSLTEDVRTRLLKISPSTVDRLLYRIRHGGKGAGIGTTKPGALIKSQVPIRTFSDWNDRRPGFMEADLVAHCGTFVNGQYLQTLVMTDISTGWTEFAILLFRDQTSVLEAIEHLREQIPFDLLGLDTDNGTEFLNYLLLGYCFDQEITFTRSRPYKKNDQCFVEEKNGSIIRKFIGYDRFEGFQPYLILDALYEQLRLYVNFFQPSLKLIEKTRQGSKVIKKYDQAQTPYQRLLAAESVPAATTEKLEGQYRELDPVHLLSNIHALQDLLWPLAYVELQRTGSSDRRDISQPRRSRRLDTKASVSYEKNTLPARPTLETAERMYRRTKKKRKDGDGRRWWRTRADPFEDVWLEVEQKLADRPFLIAKTILYELQQAYPGKFQDGQLRTLQRRVKHWRSEQMDDQMTAENPYSIPDNGKSG